MNQVNMKKKIVILDRTETQKLNETGPITPWSNYMINIIQKFRTGGKTKEWRHVYGRLPAERGSYSPTSIKLKPPRGGRNLHSPPRRHHRQRITTHHHHDETVGEGGNCHDHGIPMIWPRMTVNFRNSINRRRYLIVKDHIFHVIFKHSYEIIN
jgi:hypothetical protein